MLTANVRRLLLNPKFRACLAVYVLAWGVHAALLLSLPEDKAGCCLRSDSASYLEYFSDPRYGFERTPGYPLFLLTIRQLVGESLDAILWAQVWLISLVPALAALFCAIAFPLQRRLWYVAGLASALSYTGLGLGHQILTEALFAPLVMAAVLALFAGVRLARPPWIVAAGVFGGLAILVKPAFLFWGLLLPVAGYLFRPRAGVPYPLRTIVVAGVIALGVPLAMSAYNHARYGVAAPSSIGVAALALYLGARTLAFVEGPDTVRYGLNASKYSSAMREHAESLPTLAARYRYYQSRAAEILTAHPATALRVLWLNAVENFPAPYDPVELRDSGLARAVPGFLNGLSSVFYLLFVIGAVRMALAGHARLLSSLLLVVASYALVTATSFWQGGRLMYPVEPLLLVVMAYAVAGRRRTEPTPDHRGATAAASV